MLNDAEIGNRVSFKYKGRTITRTVIEAGPGYAVVFLNQEQVKILTSKLSSILKM